MRQTCKIRVMDADTGRERFHRYIDKFAETSEDTTRGRYPDLKSRPWYDTAYFPLAVYLEKNYEAIRSELLTLDSSGFQQAHNRIKRSGSWDVLFFYERGYRRDENCNACPVVMNGIDNNSAMRTVAGLVYLSRLRAGAHISAHRGPTNMRLRCHLGVTVPQGDCAIRVGEDVRRWQEGRCMVFDDYFEHEAWNHTENDRIVLVVDMWHPELSATEVALLNGLHQYAYSYARELNKYWAR
jgi:aspartate beta-hydroxylase